MLDLRLPSIDGISVREELAAKPETKDIPIVVVTGESIDAARLSDVRFLRKPVAPDDLLATVRAAFATGMQRHET